MFRSLNKTEVFLFLGPLHDLISSQRSAGVPMIATKGQYSWFIAKCLWTFLITPCLVNQVLVSQGKLCVISLISYPIYTFVLWAFVAAVLFSVSLFLLVFVSHLSGSFRGGHWRYLPIRNHDNRYFADWIRLCPGLSKNSEDGNSCPKSMDSITMKLTALQVKIDAFGDQNGQREQLWRYAAVRPKDKTNQSYLFWLPRAGLGQGRAG